MTMTTLPKSVEGHQKIGVEMIVEGNTPKFVDGSGT